MPLHKPRTGHDGPGDLVESFQQPLGGGLSRPACGIARTPSRDVLALLYQRVDDPRPPGR